VFIDGYWSNLHARFATKDIDEDRAVVSDKIRHTQKTAKKS